MSGLFKNVKCVFSMVLKGRVICIFYMVYVLFICSLLSSRPFMTKLNPLSIIIIDDFHPIFVEKLNNAGFNVTYLPHISGDEAISKIKDFDIVAVRSKVEFTKALIQNLPNLKCIARGGAGMDNIDKEVAFSQNISLLNAPEGNRDAVAEHAVGLLLAFSNNIVKGHNEIKQNLWQREENRGFEIGGKTIGIIGFGNTGSAFAKKLSGFNCQVIFYDKYLDIPINAYAKQVSLSELQNKADIVSLHIPLTTETIGMVNQDFLSSFKNKITLINTSRGKIVDTNIILENLINNTLNGFLSDVLENERLSTYSIEEANKNKHLMKSDNVILTPHVAGWTKESYERIALVLAEKLIEYKTK